MNYLARYEIAFKGLKEGHHVFNFDIDDKFFEMYENSEVSHGKLTAEVKVIKQTTLMTLEFAVKGKVELQCDNCLENYLQPIKTKHKVYVKFGSQNDEYDDIIVLSQDEYQINIAYNLYELIILGLPLRHIHPKKECDPEMIKKLNEYLVDEVVEPIEDNNPIDERWSELKKLLDNK
jgi:uncharacterized protein